MSTQYYLAQAGGALVFVSFALYIWSILFGRSRPVIATWAIWGGLNILTLVGMLADNVATPQSVMVAIGSAIVFLLSLRFGKPGWNDIDRISLAFGVVAIGLWWLSGTPTFAIVMSLTAIAIGNIPTYVSVLQDPTRESAYAWMIATLSSFLTLLSVETWSISSLTQPVVFLTTQLLMLYLILMPRRRASVR